MGLGLHGGGVSTAKFFADQGAEVTVTDLKIDDDLAPSLTALKNYKLRYVLGRHDESDFKTADLIIKNPGVPEDSEYLLIAKKHKIPIDTAMGVFLQLCPSHDLIGVTGTKGKSTTASLIYEIIKKTRQNVVIAGNIRISPLAVLDKIDNDTTVVLELSSWNLDDIRHLKISPRIAVITNIYPDHLNRYLTLADYVDSKKGIFKFQTKGNFLILNYDNDTLRSPSFHLGLSHIYWFSKKNQLAHGTFIKDGNIIYNTNGFHHTILNINEVKLKGNHNLENILATISAASIWGAKRTQIAEAVKNFSGIADRLEFLKEAGGVRYFNDTTATTPEAAVTALETLTGPIILIAGGADKNLNYKNLAETIKKRKVKKLILFKGKASSKILKELKQINFPSRLVDKNLTTMTAAFSSALDTAQISDTILLSPGAASFGIFKNEFDRGDQFKKLVSKLKSS